MSYARLFNPTDSFALAAKGDDMYEEIIKQDSVIHLFEHLNIMLAFFSLRVHPEYR